MSNESKKVIRPRDETPLPGQHQTTLGRLPDDVMSEHVQRLAVFSAIGAGLWTFGLVMDSVITPLTVGAYIPTVNRPIEIVGIVVSLALLAYVRLANHSAQTKTEVGLYYMIANAIGVSLLNTWARTPSTDTGGLLSWNIIVILVSSMIVPTTPYKMLAASIVAASMDPLGVWVAHLRGVPVPSVINTFVLYMPNYACAIVAVLPSHVLQKMGRRLRQAQDMGSYHLVELLGRGGMGEVWRAEHQLLARSVAVKLVRPELLGSSNETEAKSMLRRFEREAQATAALSSPHTIRVFDFGVTADRTFYYVMELLAGRDLETLVREFGPVPADRTLFLLKQVCHSLADAHARGLVHRDVTPANIYACRMGLDYDFVKVLDFGLVKFNDQASMQHTLMTDVQTRTGTPAFMAPEVIMDEGAVDHRADIYALGCVAYYLLTGQLVFEGDTPMKMFLEHLQAQPIPPSRRTEMPIPPELDALVLACLEKDPANRPQNARELLRMMERISASQSWTNDHARAWWDTHLLDLTGPLALSEVPTMPASREVAMV